MLFFGCITWGMIGCSTEKGDSYGAEFRLAIPAEGFGDVVACNSTRYGTHGFVG